MDDKYFKQGFEDYQKGISENPYSIEQQHQKLTWGKGWAEAEQQEQTIKKQEQLVANKVFNFSRFFDFFKQVGWFVFFCFALLLVWFLFSLIPAPWWATLIIILLFVSIATR